MLTLYFINVLIGKVLGVALGLLLGTLMIRFYYSDEGGDDV